MHIYTSMYAKPSGIQTLCIEVTAGSPSCKQTVDLKSALWKIFFFVWLGLLVMGTSSSGLCMHGSCFIF